MLKGAIHIHSRYSDGELSLRELREIFASAGCAFVCLADHAEAFDADKLQAYVDDCAALSDEGFRFIAGLEYRCKDRMHVLGYGVTSPAETEDPEEVIRHIQGAGGVSVIAHPRDAAFPWIESFKVLPDGIEVWNSKYDGRYAPRTSTFALLSRLQKRKPKLGAFYGQDLHWREQYRGLFTLVERQVPRREQVLQALRRGEYFAQKGNIALPSTGRLPSALLERLTATGNWSRPMRACVMGMSSLARRAGLRAPDYLKAQLRRIF
jgi:hypothetical protein